MNFPIDYDYPLFRPPSEGNSVIFQVTYGCSWNNCKFCEMYKTKSFRIKSEEQIANEISRFKNQSNFPVKIFLADGDSFILSPKKLHNIIEKLNAAFPKIQRISAYALPKNINSKTIEELKLLREAGIKILYIGVESGDDELLKLINKGETYNSTLDALLKLKAAGIKSSVMFLNGLGGKKYTEQHAENSAKIITASQPDFFSTLVLSFPFGEEHYSSQLDGNYVRMSQTDLFKELYTMIDKSKLENSIFRSDHASNYLILKGILSRDKDSMLEKLNKAINKDSDIRLREEWQRGL